MKFLKERFGIGSVFIWRKARKLFGRIPGWASAASRTKKGWKPKLDKNVEEDLIAENQRLRMKPDYLKKLRVLIQKEESQNKKCK